jgi:hypothetical protein
MANRKFGLGILVISLVFGMTVVGCDSGSGGGGGGTSTTSYTYTRGMYVMTITKTNSAKSIYPSLDYENSPLVRAVLSAGETATYTLKYDGKVKSSGQVKVIVGTDNAATFTPASGKPPFTGTFSDENMLEIPAPITLDDGTTAELNSMDKADSQTAAFAEYWGIWKGIIDGTNVTLQIGDGVWEIWIGNFDHSTGTYIQENATTANIFDNQINKQTGVAKTGANVTMKITLNNNSDYPGTYNLTR